MFTKKGLEWLHGLNNDSVECYLRILEFLDEEIKLLSKELVGVAENDEDIKLLMTIPGIGYYTAVLMKSEIGDIGRFVFPERLCSYAGLVPSTHASGKTVRIAVSRRKAAAGFVGLWLRLLRRTFTSMTLR